MRHLNAKPALRPTLSKREIFLTLFILLLGAFVTYTICFFIERSEKEQRKVRFQRLVESRIRLFESAGQNYEELLFSLRNLMVFKPDLKETEFTEIALNAIKRHPPIQALEWVPRVSEHDRATVEQKMREAGHTNFMFSVRDDQGRLIPAPATNDHFPILYVAPYKGNEPALGFDLAFGPSRATLAKGRDEADTVLTGKFRLVQEMGNQEGLISISPVYQGQIIPKTVEERRRLLAGYVQIVFRLGDLVEGILGQVSPGGVDILIEDMDAPPEQRQLYFHSSRLRGTPAPPVNGEEMRAGLSSMQTIRMGERDLVYYFRPAPEWLASMDPSRVPAVTMGGTIITALVAFLVLTISRRAAVVEEQVSERTAELKTTNEQLSHENRERKLAEMALRESESRFRSLVEHAPVGVWQLEPDGQQIRYLNPVLRQMLGLPLNEPVEGKNIRDFIAPEFKLNLPAHLEERMQGISSAYEIEYLRRDGSRLPVQVFGAPLKGESGQLAGVIGLSIDITERRQAEQAFIEERQLLHTLIDTLPDPIFVKDKAGRFLATNEANRKILRLQSTGDIVGKTVFDYFSQEVAELYFQDDMAVINSGSPIINREEPCKLPDGTQGYFLTSKVALRNSAGAIIGLVGISRDITKEKAAEAEQAKFEQKLQETQKLESLGVLAGGIAHDFNNLLTGILGHANLAKLEFPGNPILFEHLDQVEKSSQRAAELCRQMLAYAGKGRFIVQNMDVTALVEEITSLLQLSISKKVTLNFRLARNLPPISGDATQLRQILMNLVINASDAIGEHSGSITVATGVMRADRAYLGGTHLAPDLPEGNYIYIEISDTGCGMSKETLTRIFDPFFTTKFTGRGLGLAAVQGIVRAHKGALKVYSEEGRGTTFRLLLPSASGPAAPLEFPAPQKEEWSGNGTALVVDDEQSVRMVSARLLESFGFSVITASDGRDAVQKYIQQGRIITLVLMDLTMPNMDGEQAFRELRKLNPEVKVLMMSGFNEQDTINRFTGKGLAGFIQKPFKREELQAKLRGILEGKA
ncbi:MAG TPA: CHASE domain-containing protein [Verrucomicrobiae bacterium]